MLDQLAAEVDEDPLRRKLVEHCRVVDLPRRAQQCNSVFVEVGNGDSFVFDCGSGIKGLSDQVMTSKVQRFSARIFISHPHWDHINTIPFFAPLYMRGNQIEIFGPYQGNLTIERAISAQMESVYFPVTVREFGARLVFRDLREETLQFTVGASS